MVDNSIIYNVNNFDYSIIDNIPLEARPRGRQYTKDKKKIKKVTCAFDIETTNLDDIEQSFMYVWQFAIGTDFVIIGRTWDDFLIFLNNVIEHLNEHEYMVVYVHNLSFEFSFLKGIYNFTNDEIFAMDRRKVLKATMFNHFEFRCSYIQSNMSLKEFTNKYDVEHKKLDDFIYNERRMPWTKLDALELEYIVNDVLGLVEAINEEMRLDGDNLFSIPMTSTGYIRRMARRKMVGGFNNKQLKDMLPDFELYQMLSEAFRGGNTHANRFYAGRVIENVKSVDESSAYPNCQVNDKMPMTEFYLEEIKPTINWVLDLIYKYKKAVVLRIAFWDVELNNKLWGCPYLSRDKCRNVINGVYDNGRILSADYLETTLTDLDLITVLEEYRFNHCEPLKVASARYGYLPKPIRDLNIELYKKKTELKNVDGQEIYYMKSKNLLNSIYGMSVQRPVRQHILFIDGLFDVGNEDEETLLLKNYRRAFMSYAWGVWTTAHARRRLENAIKLLGNDFIYCDTDSVYYINEHDFTSLNVKCINDCKKSGSFAYDKKGKTHYMGVWEEDKQARYFKTLGAKKYCIQDEDGTVHLTLAGVSKEKGAEELQERGGINAFKEGFVFIKGGGTEAKYNDNIDITIYIDNKPIRITDNLFIKESTYTLGITDEYDEILRDSELWLEIFKKEML